MMRVINLDSLTKLNATTYVDNKGTPLQILKDFKSPQQPIMFKIITCKGRTVFTRCEISAARELNL